MGPFNLAVELGGIGLDVGMTNALVFDVPVEFGLELVTIIGSDFADAGGKLFDDMVDESDGTGLGVALVDFEGPDAGSIINICALISFDRFVVFAL